MYSRDAIAFEANKIGLAETIYVDMASVDLDALEILFSVVSNRKNTEIRGGIDSCAAVIVFVPGK